MYLYLPHFSSHHPSLTSTFPGVARVRWKRDSIPRQLRTMRYWPLPLGSRERQPRVPGQLHLRGHERSGLGGAVSLQASCGPLPAGASLHHLPTAKDHQSKIFLFWVLDLIISNIECSEFTIFRFFFRLKIRFYEFIQFVIFNFTIVCIRCLRA